ncbi:hypothetical protein T492DRAFT_861058, partial [Pavlovales sp. CCMP2436]
PRGAAASVATAAAAAAASVQSIKPVQLPIDGTTADGEAGGRVAGRVRRVNQAPAGGVAVAREAGGAAPGAQDWDSQPLPVRKGGRTSGWDADGEAPPPADGWGAEDAAPDVDADGAGSVPRVGKARHSKPKSARQGGRAGGKRGGGRAGGEADASTLIVVRADPSGANDMAATAATAAMAGAAAGSD